MKEQKTNKVKAWWQENKDVVKAVAKGALCAGAGAIGGAVVMGYFKNHESYAVDTYVMINRESKEVGYKEVRREKKRNPRNSVTIFDTLDQAEKFANDLSSAIKELRETNEEA